MSISLITAHFARRPGNGVYAILHTASVTPTCLAGLLLYEMRTKLYYKFMYDTRLRWLRLDDILHSAHRSHHKSSFSLIPT